MALFGLGFALGRVNVAAGPVGDNGYIALVLTHPSRPRTPAAGGNSAARTLAHEVRNPLAGIRAAAQLISRGDEFESVTLSNLFCKTEPYGSLSWRCDSGARVQRRRPRTSAGWPV